MVAKQAIVPNPADKRGLGVVFRGMQTSDSTFSPLVPNADIEALKMTIRSHTIVINAMEKQIAWLMLPWWKRLWLIIRRKKNV